MREHKCLVHRLMHALCAAFYLGCQSQRGSGIQCFSRLSGRQRVWRKPESMQRADMLAFNHHVTRGGNFRF